MQFMAAGTRFELVSSFGNAGVQTALVGAFNVDNLLAVLAVLLGNGISLSRAVAAIGALAAPPGRLEVFSVPGKPLVVVDYAHTPDALEQALQVLRRHCAGRLTVVFGCGGDRDRGKRPLMGPVAARSADRIVLTDDNPRSEDGLQIIADIQVGTGAAPVMVVRDRRDAIAQALQGATVGDVVLVAGKGHETTQVAAGGSRDFSDRQAVREMLSGAA
jgi:UDP-N-acetylmuramoyl-L-alanyl-D-glutamate--2,6-diaminopimelate ligase